MSNRLLRVVVATLSIAGLTAASSPSVSAASGGTCSLQGSANLTPGLSTSAQPFTYNFSGGLTNCQSSDATSPAAGTIGAGVVWQAVTSSFTDPVTHVTTTHTEHFTEPTPTGSGSCGSSTTSGTAFVTWADNTVTLVGYQTTGALAAVALQGNVIDSIQLSAPDHAFTWEPSSLTVTTTRYNGSSSLAALVFQPPDPSACNSPAGVGVAAISGQVGLGKN